MSWDGAAFTCVDLPNAADVVGLPACPEAHALGWTGQGFECLPQPASPSAPLQCRPGDTLEWDGAAFACVRGASVLIGVEGDFPDLEAALFALDGVRIPRQVEVALEFDCGEHRFEAPVVMTHPQGDRIRLLGAQRCEQPRLVFSASDGIIVRDGHRLGGIEGVTLVGDGRAAGAGLRVEAGGIVRVGERGIRITGFETGISARRGGRVLTVDESSVLLDGNADGIGVVATTHATVEASGLVVSGFAVGVEASANAVVLAPGAVIEAPPRQGDPQGVAVMSTTGGFVAVDAAAVSGAFLRGLVADASGTISAHGATLRLDAVAEADGAQSVAVEAGRGGVLVGDGITAAGVEALGHATTGGIALVDRIDVDGGAVLAGRGLRASEGGILVSRCDLDEALPCTALHGPDDQGPMLAADTGGLLSVEQVSVRGSVQAAVGGILIGRALTVRSESSAAIAGTVGGLVRLLDSTVSRARSTAIQSYYNSTVFAEGLRVDTAVTGLLAAEGGLLAAGNADGALVPGGAVEGDCAVARNGATLSLSQGRLLGCARGLVAEGGAVINARAGTVEGGLFARHGAVVTFDGGQLDGSEASGIVSEYGASVQAADATLEGRLGFESDALRATQNGVIYAAGAQVGMSPSDEAPGYGVRVDYGGVVTLHEGAIQDGIRPFTASCGGHGSFGTAGETFSGYAVVACGELGGPAGP